MNTRFNRATDETPMEHGSNNSTIRVQSVFNPWLKSTLPWCLGGWAILLSMFTPSAQNYAIDWFKISGGGGASKNGSYAITGTIGQADAGPRMSGGNFAV